jgi:hypothetical protein
MLRQKELDRLRAELARLRREMESEPVPDRLIELARRLEAELERMRADQ